MFFKWKEDKKWEEGSGMRNEEHEKKSDIHASTSYKESNYHVLKHVKIKTKMFKMIEKIKDRLTA